MPGESFPTILVLKIWKIIFCTELWSFFFQPYVIWNLPCTTLVSWVLELQMFTTISGPDWLIFQSCIRSKRCGHTICSVWVVEGVRKGCSVGAKSLLWLLAPPPFGIHHPREKIGIPTFVPISSPNGIPWLELQSGEAALVLCKQNWQVVHFFLIGSRGTVDRSERREKVDTWPGTGHPTAVLLWQAVHLRRAQDSWAQFWMCWVWVL